MLGQRQNDQLTFQVSTGFYMRLDRLQQRLCFRLGNTHLRCDWLTHVLVYPESEILSFSLDNRFMTSVLTSIVCLSIVSVLFRVQSSLDSTGRELEARDGRLPVHFARSPIHERFGNSYRSNVEKISQQNTPDAARRCWNWQKPI